MTGGALSSLAERDESSMSGPQSTLDAIVSSPVVPRTPATAGRVKPDFNEMHPSQAHRSTTQKPDSGLRLGFMDIDAKGDVPSGAKQQTPSKDPALKAFDFDFRFAHPAPQLGPEAQRMMDDLREEALRIKAKLAAEREEQKRMSGEDTTDVVVGRKFAKPRGKAGRFSEVHMAEFKKMDSIAGHPSSFRAQPARFAPPVKSLKRTQSKAKLAEREDIPDEKSDECSTERLENTAPAKRARQAITDDISSVRLVSRDGGHKPSTTPTLLRTQPSLLTSITTPTKASLARAASIKKSGIQFPTLSRSPFKSSLIGTPRTLPKPASTNSLKILKSEPRGVLRTPGRFERVKSILRHPSASLKKPSAIPSLARSPSAPNVDKPLPSVPTTPSGSTQSKSVKTMKHINFTSEDINVKAAVTQSPSPFKSGIPRSAGKMNLTQKLKSAARPQSDEVQYPVVTGHPNLSEEVIYPSLNSPHPITRVPRAIKSPRRPPPSVPGTFTFRSDHTINFGASPKGFGSSLGQSSVRQVRPSILPNTMPGSFPDTNKENNSGMLPSIPHGFSNKKRHRDTDDEEEEPAQSPNKKHKAVAEGEMLMAPRLVAEKKATQSQVTSPTKKVLSLSRLNMLARPRMRK